MRNRTQGIAGRVALKQWATRVSLTVAALLLGACATADQQGSASSASTDSATSGPKYDVLITNGRIVDGTGNPWYKADIGIAQGKIVAIGSLQNASAARTINAGNRIVSPGFVDLMGQSSFAYVADRPTAESRLRQGITTHASGEGWSHAPQNRFTQPDPEVADGRSYRWTRFSEYFDILEERKLPLNVVHKVGAAQVRRVVLGDNDVDPSARDMAAMKALVRQAMEDGATGLASSLIYPPGNYASTDELVELAKEIAPFGGTYFTHMRNESHDLLGAIDEALEIGRRAGVSVHIYHLKAAGNGNWPLFDKAIDKINAARASGMNVTADIYPYINNGIGLGSFIAPQHYASGRAALLARLDDKQFRDFLRAEIEAPGNVWENWYQNVGSDWGKVVVTQTADNIDSSIVGHSIAESANILGMDVWDTFFELVKAGTSVAPQSMNDGQKRAALNQPWVSVETDTAPANPATSKSTHPRAFGAFPRVLARYVRENQWLSLEDAVRRMTSLPAQSVGIRDRGLIELGMAADIVVFDENRITDTATFAKPMQYAKGIDYLLVNGELVIDDGRNTGARPGQVLRPRIGN
ncbi:N-acyl-D-amino-acid deacylase family protein [Woeseia oceani]|uniref:N-acyl-D-amino-acid deacylase family protein n=1 Tax=Woeseia oceani TaxID=1548547 RepID=UPI0009F3DE18|nr:D-aminoacylase [Woeseia oceani]